MPENLAAGQFVDWFRHSSPYINAHRGKTFVIYFGGDTAAHELFGHHVHDFALLNSLGVKLLLVHGAKPQVEACLKVRGVEARFADGVRITDDKVLPIIKEAVGRVRMEIEALLSMGIANSPMAGARIRVASGNFVTARPMGVRNGIDYCHTGEVRRIDTDAIRRYLDEGTIVLLSPIGYSPTGEIFNLSAKEVATAAAMQLKADKLIFLTDERELCDEDSQVLHQMTPSEAEEHLKRAPEPPHPYLIAAIKAVRHGVRRAHLVDPASDGAMLLELFTRNGVGTLVTSDSYDNIRQATIDDIPGLLELIEPLERDGILVRRSRERLEMEVNHFTVMERDGMIIGCGALYPFPEDGMAELACLAVHPDYQRQGRAETIMELIEQKAFKLNIKKLFVLTSRTAHWFVERGFQAGEINDLPMQKQALYNFQRKSKVFLKPLEARSW